MVDSDGQVENPDSGLPEGESGGTSARSGSPALAVTQAQHADDAVRQPTPVIVKDGDGEREDKPDPLLGKILGGLYKVEERIGEGGMGTVYSAVHIHLGKRFAVKVLAPKVAADHQAMERLRQEAVAASSIEHDNIVNVVSFDSTDDGNVFIVMELLRGEPLSDVVEKGPLSTERAIPIAFQICRALHAAHDAGIVHRDLKPENIFLVRKGDLEFVKVLDFGISKVKTAETEKVRMTRTGQLVGTPLYMSPEQARGEAEIDRRADIYALGVILFEMLTGVPPFEGGNYFQLLWKHGNEQPPRLESRARGEGLPEALGDVLMKMLAKRPEDRFDTMAQAEAALAAAVPHIPTLPHFVSHPSLSDLSAASATEGTPTEARARRLAITGAIALILVTAILALVGLFLPDEPATRPNAVGEPATEPVPRGTEEPAVNTDSLPTGALEPAPPEQVSVHFLSEPSGATVRIGERELGITPTDALLALSDDPVLVQFTLPGHREHRVSVVPAEGAMVVGRLRPTRPHGGVTNASKSIKMSF